MTATAALFAVVVTTAPLAQQPPDVSGTWVATRDTPKALPAAPTAVFGERFGLRVAGGTATLTRVTRGASFAIEFPVDGTEVRATLPPRPCMGDAATLGSMSREADALVYTLISNIPAGTAQPTRGAFKYHFRLEGPDTLVVESTMRDSAQAAPRQVGSVYRRTTEALPPLSKGPNVKVAPATIADIAWLAGEWEGQRGPSAIEERWTPAAGGAMLAISRTTRAGTMPEFEFLCIAERAGGLVYTAMPNAGAQTDFLLTAIDAQSATFENPDHNFPQKIQYSKRADGGLDATISGGPGTKPIVFPFKRR